VVDPSNISNKFLPTSLKEVKQLGWDYIDVILVTGDAYVDHPSFGIAIIARILEKAGYRVAIIPQPNWRDDLRDFKRFGPPRLFFGISAGNIDSMLNHYTANKRLRSDDAYTPGGKAGFRPDYATIVYSNIVKKIYPEIPIVLGGIEASMRRFVHYDYWQDKLQTSILELSNADLLVYGMGEKPILNIADMLNETGEIYNCYNIKQIAYLSDKSDNKKSDIVLHSYSDVLKDKLKYAQNFVQIESQSNTTSNKRIVQDLENHRLIVNPVEPLLNEKEIDDIYALNYTRLPHPRYNNKSTIPAYEMIKNSVTIHRGCFGGCSFCTISVHQGKRIAGRSQKSIINELEKISQSSGFKGHISDIGAPSANMYKMEGFDTKICEKCKKSSCIFPFVCKNLNTSHKELYELYKKALEVPNINKITIGSGVRYDIALHESEDSATNNINAKYLELLISKFVSGRLKVAPEHCSPKVLKLMRKTSFNEFKKLKSIFDKVNNKYNLDQQLIPYFISSHPGCTEYDMAELAIKTKNMGFKLEQVQSFTPTPMTLSTVMYYTGIDPYTGEKVFSAKSKQQKENQLKYFFWYKPEIKKELIISLKKAGRNDIIDRLFANNYRK
jgi:uncharacterized radical SAM protein YgiQ